MSTSGEKESRFMAIVSDNRQMIYKVCYMYASDQEELNDLYQEVLANLWQGLDSYRGDSRMSTWIYRVAFNTCVTYIRHNAKHGNGRVALDDVTDVQWEDSGRGEKLRHMYRLISCLDKMDKAIILMWLDEKSYEEISELTGLPRNTVATRLHRIKHRLTERNKDE